MMNNRINKNRFRVYVKCLFIIFIVAFSGLHIQSDDKELFMGINIGTNVVRPNVMILMDSSGSMNTVIFYPKKGIDNIFGTTDDGYDHNVNYSGTVESRPGNQGSTNWHGRWIRNGNADILDKSDLEGIDGKNHWTGCYENDGTPNNFRVGSYGTNYFQVGDEIFFRDTSDPYDHARATIKSKYTDANGETWFELEDIEGGPITVDGGFFQRKPETKDWELAWVRLYGGYDMGNITRYPSNYVDWIFIHATREHREAISHFATYATFDVTQTPATEISNCATPGNDDLGGAHPRIKETFTRIKTAREVICHVARDSQETVKLGLFEFDGSNGGDLVEHLGDQSDENSFVAYRNNVWGIEADGWTPLAETLADIWYYYKPGPASKTYWPVDWEIAKGVNHSTSNPVSPIEYWCQNNYVVIMTDGESTQDRFDDASKYGDSIFVDKPVKRTEPWLNETEAWKSWNNGWGDPDNYDQSGGVPSNYDVNGTYCPNYSCWSSGGSDYLDDVAYFLRHQDMFPDDHFGTSTTDGWPGDQNVYTYAIGFNVDNHLLQQAAINGDGAYYTANNYEELVEAFFLVITSINLRNYAFSSITAPKKSTTATNDTLSASYVGYFLPSQSASIWEGHLVAFKLNDLWGWDKDINGEVGPEEFVYPTEDDCLADSQGNDCERYLALEVGHQWDVSNRIPSDRNLFTHNDTTTLIDFDTTNKATLQPLLGAANETEAETIINKINYPQFADVFHSDVGYVGPPSMDKSFYPNINPPGADDETYEEYYEANKDRRRAIYVGTNDGILHMFYADAHGQSDLEAGKEVWGFIPDEVLPSLHNIVMNGEHTYTVDGRITHEDVYWDVSGDNKWSTLMVFGLRRGGNTFYGIDITTVGTEPKMLWKFEEPTFSGQSWGKPVIAKIRIYDPANTSQLIDKYVVFLTGGMAYNWENDDEQEGKAIFMLDAKTGELMWMIGYDSTNGKADDDTNDKLDVESTDNIRYLTKADVFNYPIPSAMTVIDSNNSGFADTVFFGNTGGHMFKLDLSNPDMVEWHTYVLYKTDITTKVSGDIRGITQTDADEFDFTLQNNVIKNYTTGESIIGETSDAIGYITGIDGTTMSVKVYSGTFQDGENILVRTYDPIYHPPAVSYGQCFKMWLFWGTGDRDRPRTNPDQGNFFALMDNGTYENDKTANLTELTWSTDTNGDAVLNGSLSSLSNVNGWFFQFPDAAEKIFDPEPLVIPDERKVPHVYFNTYQPPPESIGNKDNPCDAPDEGSMTLYDLSFSCSWTTDADGNEEGTTGISGGKGTGRLAGGGMYGGKEYILFESESGDVASAPQSDTGEPGENEANEFKAVSNKLYYHGGIVYWKVKKR